MAFEHTLQTLYPGSFAWDFHNTLEVLDSNNMPSLDPSTGYLQDAITEWSNRCKRRRVAMFSNDHQGTTEQDCLVQNYWNWNFSTEDPFANDGCWDENTTFFEGDLISSVNSTSSDANEAKLASMEMKKMENEKTGIEKEQRISSSASCKDSVLTNGPYFGKENTTTSRDPLSSETMVKQNSSSEKRKARVAYPFAVVKPGGVEGDVTLDDINERILMRPNRPVRHPVGEFACHPCVSADGPGLSGKAIVALTRIHTQGRGTVTIIRTKG